MNKLEKKISIAKSRLLIDHKFFGYLTIQLKFLETTSVNNEPIDTMATDGKCIYWNPSYVKEINIEEVIGVLAHEIWHCGRFHITRRGFREPKKWNIAADYSVNPDLLTSGFKLPSGFLYEKKYVGWAVEEIYEDIPDNHPSLGKNTNDPGKCGQVLDAAPPTDKPLLDEIKTKWEIKVRQAISIDKASNNGELSADLKGFVKELGKPRVDYKVILRNFVNDNVQKKWDWNRANRRYLPYGIIIPGMVQDGINHAVVVLDTSGSITQKILDVNATEVKAFMDESLVEKLTVIYADSEVKKVEEYQVGDEIKFIIKGGGGTNFRDSFKYISEHCQDAVVVIYYTDLEVTDFGDEPNMPVLWAVYGNPSNFERLAGRTPFGEAIHIF